MTLRESFDKRISEFDKDGFAELFTRRKLSWDIIWTMIEGKDWSTSIRHNFDFNWGEMCVIYQPDKEDDFGIWFIEGKLR